MSAYSWNTPFSTEHRTERRHLRRFETREHARAVEIAGALRQAGYDVTLRARSAGPGCGYTHYDLEIVTAGDDWARADQFADAERVARADQRAGR